MVQFEDEFVQVVLAQITLRAFANKQSTVEMLKKVGKGRVKANAKRNQCHNAKLLSMENTKTLLNDHKLSCLNKSTFAATGPGAEHKNSVATSTVQNEQKHLI